MLIRITNYTFRFGALMLLWCSASVEAAAQARAREPVISSTLLL